MTTPPRTARQIAFDVLEQWRASGRFAAGLLENAFSQSNDLSAADRGLASELTYGVIRRQETINAVLRPRLNRPPEQVEPPLWTLLQLGTYQLLFHSTDAQHAAIHETVELTKWLDKSQWTGFSNGILRSVQRDLDNQPATSAAADSIPIGTNQFLKLARPLLPDPAVEPAKYIAAGGSLPDWLVENWSKRFDFDEMLRLSVWFNSAAATWLRINPLRADGDELLARLADAGVEATLETPLQTTDSNTPMIRLAGTAHVRSLPGFSDGHFTVQDVSAAHAATLLAPKPGQRVLDLCAAPGTKSTHLAELMNNQGQVVAVDSHSDRLKLIAPAADRLGLSIIEPVLVAESGEDLPRGPFDAVLVDVPCSNTGVLGKRPEARWRLKRDEPQRLAELQLRLLKQAAQTLAPNGRLVYSTCSIEPIENDLVVHAFLEQTPDFKLLGHRSHVPGMPADGGFQSLLVRQKH
jgi:16S rRNA (cytosine967-C5)-methyltransferase